MRSMRIVMWGVLVVAMSASASAQVAVTAADLGRLDVDAAAAGAQAARLRASDPTLVAEIEQSLTLLKEEIIYLRVRLRREGAVPRADYTDLRDRIETLRVKAAGEKVTAQPYMTAEPTKDELMRTDRVWILPVGTEMDVRLQTALNSATAKVEQRFEATTIVDLKMGGTEVVLPAGTVVRGFVGSVRAAGRVDRKGSLTLSFDEILPKSGPTRLRASVTKALDGRMSEDAGRIGTGAVLGAIVGGILGGGKGMMVGVLVGGGGTIAATDGSDVDLPAGTIFRVRIDSPLEIR
ncbi:MAG: hypothetical protein HQ485_04745 [Acidobacteria bacterium]|jgi:hypothetical protein|nr:hypothetical protein [Acidobacteriota bacterium]